jgi:hypothetical protein
MKMKTFRRTCPSVYKSTSVGKPHERKMCADKLSDVRQYIVRFAEIFVVSYLFG